MKDAGVREMDRAREWESTENERCEIKRGADENKESNAAVRGEGNEECSARTTKKICMLRLLYIIK